MKKKFLLGISLLAIAGTMVAAFAGNAVKPLANAEEQNYVLTLDGSCFDSSLNEAALNANPRTFNTANGNPIIVTSDNDLCKFSNKNWDSTWLFYNGVQADAEFHNTTAISGIKKIEFDVRWNMFKYTGTEEDVINITVASDASFTEDLFKVKVIEKAAVQECADESFSYDFDGSASYFKFDFGTSTTGKNRHQFCVIKKVKITYSCTAITEKHLALNDKNHLAKDSYDPSVATNYNFKSSDSSDITISMYRAFYIGDGFYKTGGYQTTDVHNVTALPNITRMKIEIKWNGVETVPFAYSTNVDFSGAGVTSISLNKGEGVSVRDTYYETFYINVDSSRPSYFKFTSAAWTAEYALIQADFYYIG